MDSSGSSGIVPEANLPTGSSVPSSASSSTPAVSPLKLTVITDPAVTFEQLLVQMFSAIVALQQRADQSDRTLAALHAMIQECKPIQREKVPQDQHHALPNNPAPPNSPALGNSQPRARRVFSHFTTPLSIVMDKLVKTGHLHPLDPKPLRDPLPSSHQANQFCAYHQMPGHHTNRCISLRHAIQNLIDDGTIVVPPPLKPNPFSNAVPSHIADPRVNQIFLSSPQTYPSSTIFDPVQHEANVNRIPAPPNSSPYAIRNSQLRARRVFSQFATPLSVVMEKLLKTGQLTYPKPVPLKSPLPDSHRVDLYCGFHRSAGHHTDSCLCLRHAIQDLIENGTIAVPLSFPQPSTQPKPVAPFPVEPEINMSTTQQFSETGKCFEDDDIDTCLLGLEISAIDTWSNSDDKFAEGEVFKRQSDQVREKND